MFVIVVSVPSSSLYKTVTVRCGHCTHLLPVNTRSLLLQPPPASQYHLPHHHNYYSPNSHYRLGEMPNQAPNFSLTQSNGASSYMNPSSSRGGSNELPRAPTTNRPPEKRQRVPSAYNRFIKEEIQRIKAENPDISHREAFSAAAKNLARLLLLYVLHKIESPSLSLMNVIRCSGSKDKCTIPTIHK
uniref:Uncharacterized protein n=1 Tax=Chenopodium quinoa TaxID=63459 RepID=A0A803N3Q1_CHEQI